MNPVSCKQLPITVAGNARNAVSVSCTHPYYRVRASNRRADNKTGCAIADNETPDNSISNMQPIRLTAGQHATFDVAGRVFHLWVGHQGAVNLVGPAGHYRPPVNEDTQTQNQTFPLLVDHPALADGGAGAEAIRSACDGPPEQEPPDPAAAVEVFDWFESVIRDTGEVRTPGLLILRMRSPNIGLRELADAVGLRKSTLQETLAKIEDARPDLARLLRGPKLGQCGAQRERRARESGRTNVSMA